jgi:predicted amidophosphoribosyltransferase
VFHTCSESGVSGNKIFRAAEESLSTTYTKFSMVLVDQLPKICPNCQAENRDAASYCLRCGTSLAETPVQTPTQPAAAPKFCVYHPLVMAQVYCSDCGAAICLSCARYGMEAVYCPTCHARRHASIFHPPPFGPVLWGPYPAGEPNRKYFG